jgi:predicted 3-demethylubiquinone-9 3-methyltransferase (glyoxalase superfamily)
MAVLLQPLITPFLWFDGRAAEAADFYCRVFPDSHIVERMQAGPEGPVMSLTIELAGQRLMLFNGGPQFRFTEAVSLFVRCATQDEVDRYWAALLDGGQAQRCGWLRDRFGLSWQIVPERLGELLSDPDPARAQRVMQSLMQMVKLDIATLENAHEYA